MPNTSTDFAVGLLGEFVRRGVRDLVLCPGSRSQALALAAAEFERQGLLRLRVRIDERVAGFLARMRAKDDQDERIRQLEQQLAELDDEPDAGDPKGK